MSSLPVFWSILVFLALLGVVLTVVAGITLGRKLGDYAYQRAMNINGITRTQTWVTIRTHANRLQLGLFLFLIGLLPLTPVPYEVRTWVSVSALCWVALGYTMASILDWRDDDRMMKMQIQRSKSREQILDAQSDRMEQTGLDTNEMLRSGDIGRESRAIVDRAQATEIQTTGEDTNRRVRARQDMQESETGE